MEGEGKMNNDFIIEIKNVSKAYKNKHVLNQLSLNILKASVFGLLGKNGSGKTTLIKTILGLLKISSGNISVFNDNPWDFKDTTKEKIGYVPQNDRIYPWLSVRQLIDYISSFYKSWNVSLINQLIKDWEINENDRFGVLSEGQAQKVSIILALGHEPDLLVLDEPVASLDPIARRQFLKTILDIVLERNCTVFFSTHITSDLERIADNVAILKDGRIDFQGELDQLKDEVKRLRIISSEKLPEQIDVEGVLNYKISNNESIISIRGFNSKLKKTLENKFNAKIEIEDMNLDEIFLELNR